jgi:hypothetical protein
MPLNQSGFVDKVGLQNLSEIAQEVLEYTSEADFNRNVDESGITHDALADHAGVGTVADGYDVGSITEGLVGYYPLDEGAGRVARDGALDNLGNLNNSPSWISGNIGSNALDFNGNQGYVNIADSRELRLMKSLNFTITMWVKRSSDVYDPMITKYDRQGYLVRFIDENNNGVNGVSFYINNNSTSNRDTIEVDKALDDNTWYHLACRRSGDGASGLTIFIDGVEQSPDYTNSESAGTFTDNTADLQIANYSTDYFDGQLDDVRFYGRALSQPEIETIATRSNSSGREVTESDIPSQSDNGVSRYEFENNVTDSWGSNDGTDNTSAGFTTGVYGQAKSFDGTDDQIPTADIDVSTVTVSAWFNYSGTGFQILLSDYDQSDRTAAFGVNGSDQLYTEFALSDTSYSVSDSEAASTGVWIHGVYTWDGTTQRLYKNGQLVGTNQPGQTPPSNDSDWHIGSDGASGGSEFNGDADDLRIYSAALSQREVEELYNRGAYRINRGDLV